MLIIKGDMPKACWNMRIVDGKQVYNKCPYIESCGHVSPYDVDYRPSDCPILGEIPDKHGRLIDADALIEKTKMWSLVRGDEYFELRVNNAIVKELLEAVPTIVEATE